MAWLVHFFVRLQVGQQSNGRSSSSSQATFCGVAVEEH